MESKQVNAWFFPHPLLWALTILMIAAEAVWVIVGGFEIRLGNFAPLLIAALAALGIGILSAGKNRQLAMLSFTIAFFIIFGKQARVMNYLTTAAAFPLVDDYLDQLDKMIGFDWVAFTGWLNARPLILEILRKAYNILPLITVFTLVYQLAFKHYEKLKEFLFVFSLTVIGTLMTGTFLPAIGAFEYNNPPSELLTNIPAMSGRYYLPHLYALRDGSMTVIPLDHLTGLIQFTSFHTTMALILTWAMRRTPLFWPFVIINTLMAASTPLYGGHYLMDLIGGAAFAILAILLYATHFKHMPAPQVFTRRPPLSRKPAASRSTCLQVESLERR